MSQVSSQRRASRVERSDLRIHAREREMVAMRMKILCVVLLVMLMSPSVWMAANAHSSESDFTYSINLLENTARITGYRGSGGMVAVPSMIEGYTVTSIGNAAFSGCTHITAVSVADSVTTIDASAFTGCTSLTSVTLGSSVASIGVSAFDGCTALTSIAIPASVASIGSSAFSGCSSLISVILPPSLSSIAYSLFADCVSLASITIPESVTGIEDQAFKNCSSLTSVVIPDSVTSLGSGAFYGCSSLTSVNIPEGLTTIESFAFSGCSSLTNVAIPDSVTSIGTSAFADCVNLANVTMGNSVNSIGTGAFRRCSSLTSIVLSDSVTSIDSSAFRECSNLTSVTMPAGLTSLGSYAFADCGSLTSIMLPNSLSSIASFVFLNCIGLADVTIPDSVTSIGNSAFRSCGGLENVTIGNSVDNIGSYAFGWCSNLESAVFRGNPPTTTGGGMFHLSKPTFTIYYYQSAQGWTNPWSGYSTSMIAEQVTPVESVHLNKEIALLLVGQTEQLQATVLPVDATNRAVVWFVVSGCDAASVSPTGLVTGLNGGTAVIRAASVEDGSIYDECVVVVDQSGFGLALAESGEKVQDELFDLDISDARSWYGTELVGYHAVTVHSDRDGLVYSDTVWFSLGVASRGVMLNTVGEHTLTVSVEGVTESRSLPVTVVAPDQSGFEVSLVNPGDMPRGSSFSLLITDARDRDGVVHNGDYFVKVRTNLSEPAVYDGIVHGRFLKEFFLDGGTYARIRQLLTVGEHVLTVSVEGVTGSRTLTVNVVVNKWALKALIARVEETLLNEADYTQQSWARLGQLVLAAQQVLNNPEATQDEVDDAHSELNRAYRDMLTGGRVDTLAVDETAMTVETTIADDGRTVESFTLSEEELSGILEMYQDTGKTGGIWFVIDNNSEMDTRISMPNLGVLDDSGFSGGIGVLFNSPDGATTAEFSAQDISEAAAAGEDISLSVRSGCPVAFAELFQGAPGMDHDPFYGLTDHWVLSTPLSIEAGGYSGGATLTLPLPPLTAGRLSQLSDPVREFLEEQMRVAAVRELAGGELQLQMAPAAPNIIRESSAICLADKLGTFAAILLSEPGEIAGTVRLQGLDDHSSVVVEVLGTDLSARADSEGKIVIDGLGSGNYQLVARAVDTVTGMALPYPVVSSGGLLTVRAGQTMMIPELVLPVGDFTGPEGVPDNQIDLQDLGYLAQCYRMTGTAAGVADLNRDGVVDLFDLVLLARNLNRPTPEWWTGTIGGLQ